MARKPNIADLSTRLLVVALGSERRWRRTLAVAAAGVAVLGVGVFAAVRAIDARDSADVEKTWGSLNACLLGEKLQKGETASGRTHAIQLSVIGIPHDKRAKPGELAWPANCAVTAATLAESARGAGNAGPSFAEAALALSNAIRTDPDGTTDFGALVDKLWSHPAAAKLPIAAAADAITAPKPATPLFTPEGFRALPRFLSGAVSLGSIRPQTYSGTKLHFIVDQTDTPEGPVLCTANGTEAAIRCMKVPPVVAKLSPGLRLVGTTDDDARPFYFAGDRGQLGIFPPEGKTKVAEQAALGASARGDGSLVVIYRKDGLRLLSQPAIGPLVDRHVLSATEIDGANAILMWDWLAYRSQAKRGAPSHLFIRKVTSARGDLAPALDVGELTDQPAADSADKEPRFSVCRSDESTALRIRGQRGDTMAFYAGGRWSAPAAVSTRGGAMTCRGVEAVTTQLNHAPEGDKDYASVVQGRCNSSGCTTTTTALKSMLSGVLSIAPSDANGITAADAAGKLMIAWNAGFSAGIRMRIAAPDRMKDTEDVVIFDGRGEDATVKLSSVVELRAIPANGFVLLFIATTAGTRVLRVEPSGALTPMATSL